MYEIFEKLCNEKGVTPYRVCKETGITTATISNWKAGRYTPKQDKMQKIAEFLGVTIEYLMTGKKKEENSDAELSARDERDIKKDLDRIMEKIRSRDDGPLNYNGVEIDDASVSMLENAIEFALRETKKENKIKYNPYKNKSR